jgi:hypothetical protein
MPTSRKIWGGFVCALGLLWLVGGVCGSLQGDWRMALLVFCGIVLLRLGRSLLRGRV